MFLIVLNRLPRLLNLCQRTDPVIILRNVRIINGAIMLRHFQGAVSHKPPKAPSLSSGEIQKGARRPPLVVSNREVRRRGRKRNLPLLLNSTPFVRQYGILLTSGVLFYAKRDIK